MRFCPVGLVWKARDRFGSPFAIALYVFGALLITIAAVLVARETAATQLTAEQAPEEVAAQESPPARPRPLFH